MGRREIALLVVLLSCVPIFFEFYAASGGHPILTPVYCVLCILALFWFAREFADSYPFAAASAVLFALWHLNLGSTLQPLGLILAVMIVVVGARRHGSSIGSYLPGAFAAIYLVLELNGISHIYVDGEITLMTVFSLASLAAYSRFERINAPRNTIQQTSLDLPATRTSVQHAPSPQPFTWFWAAICLVSLALALWRNEQAVALPFALFVIYGQYRARGFNARIRVPLASCLVLSGYLVLSHFIALEGSRVFGLIDSTAPYSYNTVLPAISPALGEFYRQLTGGFSYLFGVFDSLWIAALALTANIFGWIEMRRQKYLAFSSLALSIIAFLPILIFQEPIFKGGPFIQKFGETYFYGYLSMALRSLFVVTLISVCGQALVSAASPRALQAPPRLVPAPGSLPHP